VCRSPALPPWWGPRSLIVGGCCDGLSCTRPTPPTTGSLKGVVVGPRALRQLHAGEAHRATTLDPKTGLHGPVPRAGTRQRASLATVLHGTGLLRPRGIPACLPRPRPWGWAAPFGA
jgi:hypothetical protein